MPQPGVTYNQMVVDTELSDEQIDRVFHALAAATRRDILRRAIEGEYSVSTLAGEYDMSFAAVQKHVAVLEDAGLVTKHPQGRERIVRGNPERLAQARALLLQLEQLWASRLRRLDAILAEPEPRQE